VENGEQGALTPEKERTYAANIEVQVLEGTVLGGGNAEKASRPVQSSTSCRLVLRVGIYRTLIRP
jgi:hypothetical protein